MTFEATQVGPRGRTVELYEFSQVGEFTRVTSAAVDQFVGATPYEVLRGLSRNEPTQGNESRSGELEVTVPLSFTLINQFRGTLPSSFPELTIYKKHLNDPDQALFTYWKGTVVNCAFKESEGKATLFCSPPSRVFDRPIPRAVYSGLCNHQLFDPGCQVIKGPYTATLPIGSLDASRTQLTIPNLRIAAAAINTSLALGLTAQEIDDFWQRGLVASIVSPVEYRMVVQTDIGGDPNTIRINIPFREVEVGAQLILSAGCGHSLDICNRKFNNAVNFGGFPYVPTLNPFEVELDTNQVATNSSRIPRFRGRGR